MQRKSTKKPVQKINPIQEAILEVRFPPDGWDGTSAGRIYERMSKHFPEKRDVRTVAFFVGPEPPSQLPPAQAPQIQLWSTDRSKLVQFGPGIIVANSVKYSTWDEFLPSLLDVAKAYLAVVKPMSIMQVSARYINRFDFDTQEVDLGKYFSCSINLPPMLNDLEEIHLHVVSPVSTAPPERPQKLRIQFGSDSQPVDNSKSTFVLDIDCVCQVTCEPKVGHIQETVEALHNTVKSFFQSFVHPTFRSAYLPEE